MSTKTEPGPFDGLERAQPDEPVFTLRAHDVLAAPLVHEWVRRRREAIIKGDLPPEKEELELIQCREAEEVAFAMVDWRNGVDSVKPDAEEKPEANPLYSGHTSSAEELAAKERHDVVKGASNALPDEPMFVLLARDLTAPELVRDWAEMREVEVEDGIRPAEDRAVVEEARQLAAAMEAWRVANDGAWRALTNNGDAPAFEPAVPVEDGVYRRRPSHVTALQIGEEHLTMARGDWPEWCAPMLDQVPDEGFETHIAGAMGWWLVKDEAGNVFTVSDPVFNATFDRVR